MGVQFHWIIIGANDPAEVGFAMNRSTTYAVLAVIAVVVLALAFAVSQQSGTGPGNMAATSSSGSGTTSQVATSLNSAQAGNETYVATLNTMERAPTTTTSSSTSATSATTAAVTTATTTSSTTTQSASSTQSQSTGNSYSYSASSQVKILGVTAIVSQQARDPTVSFSVQFENIGSSVIYVVGGGGGDVSATITSGSAVLTQVSSPRCEIATAIVPVSPGADSAATVPGCWSGFYYSLAQPGTVQVQLTLGWSNGTTQPGGSVEISAEFTLS